MYLNKLDGQGEKDKFVKSRNLPRLYHEELENMNSYIISKEIELLTKILPTKKSPGSNDFAGEFHHTFQELKPAHYGCIRKPEFNKDVPVWRNGNIHVLLFLEMLWKIVWWCLKKLK